MLTTPTYLVLPLAVQGSRSFQPDPGMVMWLALSAYFLYRWCEEQDSGNETSRQAWQELADYGIRAVVSDWERRFLALILDPAEFTRQRELLRRNLAQEAEERFADWLVRGFFAEVGDQTLAALLEEAGRRGRQYLFLNDEAGNLLYDEAGDPLVRGTRDGEPDTYSRDREAWGSAMRDRMAALLVSWEQTATAGLDELLAVVPPERQPDLEWQWAVRLADARQSRQRELDKIFLLEQSRFDRWRLQDRYSLRLHSEGETAAAVAAQLIEKTQAEVDSGLAALLHGLNTDVGEVNVEGTPIDGEQWQEQFRSELQKGLTLWDRAEEEFFLRRIEWERKAGYDLAEGQEAWLQAFETLQSRRSQWLNEFRQSLDQGRLVWESRSQELDQAVQKAIAELDSNLEAQRASLAGRAENLVAMLGQSLQMMDTARENWEYWLGGGEAVPMNVWDMRRYYLQTFLDRRADTVLIGVTGGEAGASSQAGSRRAADLAQSFLTDFCFASARGSVGPDGVGFLPGILDDWERRVDEFIAAGGLTFGDGEEAGGFRAYFTSLLGELREYQQEEKPEQALYWMEEIYTAYERFATEAHRELASTYGLVVFGDPLGFGYADDPGISGMIGALEDGSWENLFLDDYQVELLKARAVRGYWEKELEIAQAVYDYSVDTSSGRPTQAETRAFYERSLRETKRRWCATTAPSIPWSRSTPP
jgi:hypothetical protein